MVNAAEAKPSQAESAEKASGKPGFRKAGLRQKRNVSPQPKDAAQEKAYVGDITPFDSGPRGVAQRVLLIAVAALAGFAVAVVVRVTLLIVSFATDLLWKDLPTLVSVPWLPIVVCGAGGVIIGLWAKFFDSNPKDLHTVLHTVKKTGGYQLKKPAAGVVAVILPLVFGGAIGPEAGLAGLIAAGCTWIGNLLKRTGLKVGMLANAVVSSSLAAALGAPFAGIAAASEDVYLKSDIPELKNVTFRKIPKLVLYAAAAFGAFGGVVLLTKLTGATMGLPRFDAASIEWGDIRWIIPCIMVGYALTWTYFGASKAFGLLAKALGERPVAKAVLCGVALGAVGIFLPNALFSGEVQSEELMHSWTAFAAWVLIATGFAKAVVTPMCLSFGWQGGTFFPCIFAGVTCGYGIAALSGADPVLCVLATASAFVAGTTRQPIMALCILLLCFPVSGLPWMIAACFAGAYLPIPKRLLS